MKRRIYAGLLAGSILLSQGVSCLGVVPDAAAETATDPLTNVGAPIWNVGGNLQTVINNLLGI